MKKYNTKFKSMIVELYKNGQKVLDLSRKYGVSEVTIYKWVTCHLRSRCLLHWQGMRGWAHVRRKFFEIPGNNGKAKKAVAYCDQIVNFEKLIKALSLDQRQKQRQLVIKPALEEFSDWLESFYFMKGKLRTVVMDTLNQKIELLRFLKDGNLESSNKLAEQAICFITMGRKNKTP